MTVPLGVDRDVARPYAVISISRGLYPQYEYINLMVKVVTLAKAVEKTLRRSPQHVAVKLLGWVDLVESEGLENARRVPGYHDEPLRGRRQGQRSIRLSRAWRAIYVVVEPEGEMHERFVEIMEVNKHDY